MSWTASLTGVNTNPQSSLLTITLSFTNGAETQTRTLNKLTYSAEEIAVYAQAVIVELETRDAAIAQIQDAIKGGPAPIQLPRDGFPTPTFDALNAERAKFAKVNELAVKLDQLNVLQAAVSANLIAATDPSVKVAQDAVTAASGP